MVTDSPLLQGRDLTMAPWPWVASLAMRIKPFLTTLESPVPPPFMVPKSLCFSFISSTYLIVLVAPRTSGCLGSFQESYIPLLLCDTC